MLTKKFSKTSNQLCATLYTNYTPRRIGRPEVLTDRFKSLYGR